ncbi:MAG: glycosyltransferase [Myxococcota bacterium]
MRGGLERDPLRVLATGFGTLPGMNAHANALMSLANAIRAELDVVTLKHARLPHQSRMAGARLFRVPVTGTPGEGRATFARAVRRQLEASSYDIVHVRGPAEGVAAAAYRDLMGFQLVYEVGTYPNELEGAAAEGAWHRDHHECLDAADLVLVGSEAAALAVRAPGRWVEVLPPGVDVDSFDGCPAHAPAPAARLLYLGGFGPERALASALAAIREVGLVRPVRALFAGEADPGRRDGLRRLADGFGLGEVVDVAGEPRSRFLPAVLAAADVLLVPAAAAPRYLELGALPAPLLEAMASRRPIVAAAVPAITELLRDDVEALLVPPGDEAALADAVLAVLREPDLAARLGDAAFARVLGGFGAAARRRRLAAIYEELAPGSQRFDAWRVGFAEDDAPALESLTSAAFPGADTAELATEAPLASRPDTSPDTLVGAPAPAGETSAAHREGTEPGARPAHVLAELSSDADALFDRGVGPARPPTGGK